MKSPEKARSRNIVPALRVAAIIVVLIVGAIAGFALKGGRGMSAGVAVFLFCVGIGAIGLLIALDTDRARNAKIEDPRDTYARWKRERDLS